MQNTWKKIDFKQPELRLIRLDFNRGNGENTSIFDVFCSFDINKANDFLERNHTR